MVCKAKFAIANNRRILLCKITLWKRYKIFRLRFAPLKMTGGAHVVTQKKYEPILPIQSYTDKQRSGGYNILKRECTDWLGKIKYVSLLPIQSYTDKQRSEGYNILKRECTDWFGKIKYESLLPIQSLTDKQRSWGYNILKRERTDWRGVLKYCNYIITNFNKRTSFKLVTI